MPVKLRLILFYFFVGLFCVLLPVICLYSLGYRLNTDSWRLERLGMISIRSIPDEVSITLGSKLLGQRAPARITDLFPGNYKVTLSKEGFKSWSGSVTVKPNWVTRLESIMLFPEKMSFEPVTDLFVIRFSVSPKGRKIVILGSSLEDRGLWIYDFLLEEEVLVCDERVFLENKINLSSSRTDFQMTWSKDEKFLIFKAQGKFFLIDLKKPNRMLDFKNLIGSQPEDALWSEKTAGLVFYLKDGKVGSYRIKTKKKDELLALDEESIDEYSQLIRGRDPEDTRFWFDSDNELLFSKEKAIIRHAGSDSEAYEQEIFTFPVSWTDIFWDVRLKRIYFVEEAVGNQGGKLFAVQLAQGPIRKLVENMRETMSDGFQMIYEAGKKP